MALLDVPPFAGRYYKTPSPDPAPKNPTGVRGPLAPKKSASKGPVRAPNGPQGPTTTNLSKQQVAAMQTYLRSQGYDLTVDGSYGPLTMSAKRDWESGQAVRSPQKWNAANAHQAAATTPATTTPAPDGTIIPPMAGAAGSARTPAATKTTPGSGSAPKPTTLQQLLALLGKDSFNPQKYAQASVNQQYNPQIAELNREIATQSSANATKNQNIEEWIKELVSSSQSAGTQADDMMKAILGGSASFDKGVGGSLSDPAAAAQYGKTAGIYDTGLKGQDAIDLLGLANQAPINALKGTELMSALQKDQGTGMNDLRGQLRDLLGAKGNAYTSALDNAVNNGITRRGERINQLATLMMLPGQLQGQGLDNFLKTQQGADAHASAVSGQAQAAANLRGTQLDNWMKNKTLTGTAPGTSINWNDPATVTQFDTLVTKTITGQYGNFNSDPKKLWDSIISEYQFSGNARAKQVLASTFSRTLDRSHANKQWMHYKMGPNGPVLSK